MAKLVGMSMKPAIEPREITRILVLLVWPKTLTGAVGRLMGVFSVLALIKYGFHFGLGAAVNFVFGFYDRLLGLAVGWTEPYLQAELLWLRKHIPLELHLHQHWKHIFVLMSIYFLREARITYQAGYRVSGIALVAWGFAVALISSVLAGAIDLVRDGPISQFLIAAIPLGGFLVFDLCDYGCDVAFFRKPSTDRPLRRVYFGSKLRYILIRPVIGVVVLLVALQIPLIRQSNSPGLLLLALLVCALAIFWLWRGLALVETMRIPGETRYRTYLRTGATALGLDMFAVFLWVGIILLTNAGLSLYGL